jgi:hypothetical protein
MMEKMVIHMECNNHSRSLDQTIGKDKKLFPGRDSDQNFQGKNVKTFKENKE